MKYRLLLTVCVFSLGLLATTATNNTAVAVDFSIDIGSAFPAPPDDILGDPGAPFAAPAVVKIPTGGFAETDAFTYGRSLSTADNFTSVFFSVDPASAGVPATAVATEAAGGGFGPGDHPADVFSSFGAGGNFQVWDGDGFPNPGVVPNLGLLEPFPFPGDNLDGLDMLGLAPGGGSIFWSVDPATVAGSPPYAGFTPADIFVTAAAPGYSGGPFGVYAGLPALGLLPGDDIDALEIFEDGVPGFTPADSIIFSLSPFSPTLGVLGGSPADILGVGGVFGPAPVVAAPAVSLGLLPSDNIDALSVIPEPGHGLLLGIGCIATAWRRKRRC